MMPVIDGLVARVQARRAADVAAGRWDLVLEGDQGGIRMFLSKNRLMLN